MRAIALKLMVIWGWRRACVCLALGAASALAMEPLSLLPVLFVTIPLFVWVLDGVAVQAGSRVKAVRSGFAAGMFFGFGYFLAGVHWVGSAFFVEAEEHAWLVPLVLFFFPLLLSLFWAIGCALAAAAWSGGIARLVILAAALAATEWVRGMIFTGFPWNTPGFAVAGSAELSQIASFVGISGLNLIVVLVSGSPALLADEPARRGFSQYRHWAGFAGLLVLLAGLWGLGRHTLQSPPQTADEVTRIRIVQPNIPQAEKWDPAHRSRIFAYYLELSDAATSPEVTGISDVDVLVWPESAPPFFIEQYPDALASIAALLPDDAILLTGALRSEPAAATADAQAKANNVFNSVLAIDGKGAVISTYDKTHLVPFGEYLPFERLLTGLGVRKLVKLPGSFTTGDGVKTISIPGVPAFGPLICYEIAFAGAVVDAKNRPAWLLNVTNDAWFGNSAGPRQHLQQARFRAIEQGLPVVRSANTGISAVIDANGHILDHLPIGVSGVIDLTLPAAAPATVYALYGDWCLAFLLALCGVCLGLLRWRRQRGSEPGNAYSGDEIKLH